MKIEYIFFKRLCSIFLMIIALFLYSSEESTQKSTSVILTSSSSSSSSSNASTLKAEFPYSIQQNYYYSQCVSQFKNTARQYQFVYNNVLFLIDLDNKNYKDAFQFKNGDSHNACVFLETKSFFLHHVDTDKATIAYVYTNHNDIYLFLKNGNIISCYGRKIDNRKQSSRFLDTQWSFVSNKRVPDDILKIVGIKHKKIMINKEGSHREITLDCLSFLSKTCAFDDTKSFTFSSTVRANQTQCKKYDDIFLYGNNGEKSWALTSNAIHVKNNLEKTYIINKPKNVEFVKIVALSDTKGFGLDKNGKVYSIQLIGEAVKGMGTAQVDELTRKNQPIQARTILLHNSESIGIITNSNEYLIPVEPKNLEKILSDEAKFRRAITFAQRQPQYANTSIVRQKPVQPTQPIQPTKPISRMAQWQAHIRALMQSYIWRPVNNYVWQPMIATWHMLRSLQ